MSVPATLAVPLMRPRIDLAQVYLCRRPVDFRKGMRVLAVLVEQELGLDPFAETVYVFANRPQHSRRGWPVPGSSSNSRVRSAARRRASSASW